MKKVLPQKFPLDKVISEFKKKYENENLRKNKILRKKYKGIIAKYGGKTIEEERKEFINYISGFKLDEKQKKGLLYLFEESIEELKVVFSDDGKTPSLITFLEYYSDNKKDIGITFKDFMDKYWTTLSEIFFLSPFDSFITEYHESKGIDEPSSWTIKLQRFFDDIKVENNYIIFEFIFDKTLNPDGFTLSAIEANIFRDISKIDKTKIIDFAVIKKELENEINFKDEPEVIYFIFKNQVYLAYKVYGNYKGLEHLFYINSITGEIIHYYQSVVFYDGKIRIKGTEPWEFFQQGTQKSWKNLPYSVIYRNNLGELPPPSYCPTGIWYGDYNSIETQTDYHGNFSNIPNLNNVLDNNYSYNVNYLDKYKNPPISGFKNYVMEAINPASPVPNCVLHFDFNANYPNIEWDTNYWRGRRLEAFYHLNYAAKFFKTKILDTSIFEPVKFSYNEIAGCACGSGSFGGKTIFVGCNNDLSQCDNGSEKDFRDTLFHEFSHSVQHKVGQPISSGLYESIWEEGWAQFGAGVLSLMEKGYGKGVNRKWPNEVLDYGEWLDDTQKCNRYPNGSEPQGIFNSLFVDYYFYMGNRATKSIVKFLPNVDNNTIMVGDCKINNYLDINKCPPNSFYRKLLNKAQTGWAIGWKQRYEVSKAFHNHILDPYPFSTEETCQPKNNECCENWWTDTDLQPFPYADDLPDVGNRAPFIDLERPYTYSGSNAQYRTIIYPPDFYESQELWFTDLDDQDKFTMFARWGEKYYIETINLSPAPDPNRPYEKIDTIIEIRNESDGDYIVKNDDCPTGVPYERRSCLTFEPTETGIYIYKIVIYPYQGPYSLTGYSNKYNLRITKIGDDYSNFYQFSHPVSGDNEFVRGKIDYNDFDLFYFFIPQMINEFGYYICGLINTKMAIHTASNPFYNPIVEMYSNSTSCKGSNSIYYNLPAGIYYIRISHPDGNEGDYKFRISFNSDIGSVSYNDKGTIISDNSYNIDNFPLNDRPIMIPTAIESAGDEDWFKFTATKGQMIHINTIALSGWADTLIQLYFKNNENQIIPFLNGILPVLQDDDGSVDGTRGSRFEFVAPANTTYYIKVCQYGYDIDNELVVCGNSSFYLGGYTLLFDKYGGGSIVDPYFPEKP